MSNNVKLTLIYHRYKKRMYYVAYNILRDEYLAEDAVHNAFIKIGNNLDKIDDIDSHKCLGFVVIIVRNVAIDIYNKRKNSTYVDIETQYNVSDDNQDIEELILSNERINEVVTGIKKMLPIYYDVFILKYFYEFSNKEISVILQIEEATIRKRLQIIRQKIKKIIGRD